jgi:hypothetical protein
MEILLILIYAALCIATFKIFRIPVNKWTLPTAASLSRKEHRADCDPCTKLFGTR